jgi:hypothetical protein
MNLLSVQYTFFNFLTNKSLQYHVNRRLRIAVFLQIVAKAFHVALEVMRAKPLGVLCPQVKENP